MTTLSLSHTIARRATRLTNHQGIKRHLSGFSFAGPRKLDDVMKTELLKGKSKVEVSDIWMSYHANKKGVLASVLEVDDSIKVIDRAKTRPFYIQPVFREGGHFMLVSQYQDPYHFLLAYLEDYKMDPNRAQPLLTFSVFTDLRETHGISFLRCDVINKGIEDKEAGLIMNNTIDSYCVEEEFAKVKLFNDNPEKFNFDNFMSSSEQKWKLNDEV